MTQCEYSYSNHGEQYLHAAMIALVPNGNRASHNAKAQSADCRWHDKAMIQHATAQCEQAQCNGYANADLMNNWIQQCPCR